MPPSQLVLLKECLKNKFFTLLVVCWSIYSLLVGYRVFIPDNYIVRLTKSAFCPLCKTFPLLQAELMDLETNLLAIQVKYPHIAEALTDISQKNTQCWQQYAKLLNSTEFSENNFRSTEQLYQDGLFKLNLCIETMNNISQNIDELQSAFPQFRLDQTPNIL